MMKKLSILLLLILVSCFIEAQDLAKAAEYFKTGAYCEAAYEFEEALPAVAEKYGDDDTLYYGYYAVITAFCFGECDMHEKSVEYYLLAKQVYEKASATEIPFYGNILNNLGYEYLHLGKFEEAGPILEEALHIAEKTVGKNDISYSTRLENLSAFYEEKSLYMESLKY